MAASSSRVDDILGNIFEELKVKPLNVRDNVEVPEFGQISHEATEIVYPIWISIGRMKYYSFSNPNLATSTYLPTKSSSWIKNYTEKSSTFRRFYDQAVSRNIKSTVCYIPGSTPHHDEGDIYFTSLLPLGKVLSANWFVEALYSQRKGDFKLECRNIRNSGIGASVLLRGDFTESGLALDKTVALELTHKQTESKWFSRLNLYWNTGNLANIKNAGMPLYAFQWVHKIQPGLFAGIQRTIDGQSFFALRYSPLENNLITLKIGKNRLRTTYLHHVNSWFSFASDMEWKRDAVIERPVSLGFGVETRHKYFATKTSASTSGLFATVVECVPQYIDEFGAMKLVAGAYVDSAHRQPRFVFGIQLN